MYVDDEVLSAAQQPGGKALRARGGFTLLEAILVLVILGIIAAMTASTFRDLSNPGENAVNATAAFMRQVRHKAVAKTSAHRVVFVSGTELRAEWARSCADSDWTLDPELVVRLQERTTVAIDGLSPGETVVCFNSRGVASDNRLLVVSDHRGTSREIEVFVGGGVRVQR